MYVNQNQKFLLSLSVLKFLHPSECSKNLTNNPQLWHTHSFILLLVCSLCLVLWECCEFPHLWEGVQLKGNKMVFLC